MLLSKPIPHSTGFVRQMTNLGSMNNSGIELSIHTRNISNKSFSWQTNLTFSAIRNEVENLGKAGPIITGSAGFTHNMFLIKEGVPLRSYYGYEIEGIWQKGDDFSQTTDNVYPGSIKYVDQNNDGTVNGEDRVILGNSFPNYTFSIGNTLSYKNFSLNFFIQGVQGVSMLNVTLINNYFPIQLRRNKLAKLYLNRWTPENPSHKYPSFVHPLSQGKRELTLILLKMLRIYD